MTTPTHRFTMADYMTTPKFTMADALQIQADHLAQWELILKPEVFAKLKALVTASNSYAKFPHDVCRGNMIDMYVHNPVKFGLTS